MFLMNDRKFTQNSVYDISNSYIGFKLKPAKTSIAMKQCQPLLASQLLVNQHLEVSLIAQTAALSHRSCEKISSSV